MSDPIQDAESASALAKAIVDTVRDPLLVLDSGLVIVAASRSFCSVFQIDLASALGLSIYDLINGGFRIPTLEQLLDGLVANDMTFDKYEVELTLPGVGQRIFVLNARRVFYREAAPQYVLLMFEDITDRRGIEHEKEELQKHTNRLLEEKDVLMRELQHRVFNSLQIIASILLMKAQSASSEARQHLEETHQRLIAVAKVQRLIQAAGRGGQVRVDPYLTDLCKSLAESMINEAGLVELEVTADNSAVNSPDAVHLGLIVTELVVNALKHAFPEGYPNPRVSISYESSGSNWQLVVSDNGVGGSVDPPRKDGLGLTLVRALAEQLHAQLKISRTPSGMRFSITHEVFHSEFPTHP